MPINNNVRALGLIAVMQLGKCGLELTLIIKTRAIYGESANLARRELEVNPAGRQSSNSGAESSKGLEVWFKSKPHQHLNSAALSVRCHTKIKRN
jgi:hypothetical protein